MDTKNLYCTGEMGEIEKLRNCASHRKKSGPQKNVPGPGTFLCGPLVKKKWAAREKKWAAHEKK